MKTKKYCIEPIFKNGNTIALYVKNDMGEKSLHFINEDHTLFAYRMIEYGIKLEECSGVMFLHPKAAKVVSRYYNPTELDLIIRRIANFCRTKVFEKFFKSIIYTIFAVSFILSTIGVIYRYKVSTSEPKPISKVFINH